MRERVIGTHCSSANWTTAWAEVVRAGSTCARSQPCSPASPLPTPPSPTNPLVPPPPMYSAAHVNRHRRLWRHSAATSWRWVAGMHCPWAAVGMGPLAQERVATCLCAALPASPTPAPLAYARRSGRCWAAAVAAPGRRMSSCTSWRPRACWRCTGRSGSAGCRWASVGRDAGPTGPPPLRLVCHSRRRFSVRPPFRPPPCNLHSPAPFRSWGWSWARGTLCWRRWRSSWWRGGWTCRWVGGRAGVRGEGGRGAWHALQRACSARTGVRLTLRSWRPCILPANVPHPSPCQLSRPRLPTYTAEYPRHAALHQERAAQACKGSGGYGGGGGGWRAVASRGGRGPAACWAWCGAGSGSCQTAGSTRRTPASAAAAQQSRARAGCLLGWGAGLGVWPPLAAAHCAAGQTRAACAAAGAACTPASTRGGTGSSGGTSGCAGASGPASSAAAAAAARRAADCARLWL